MRKMRRVACPVCGKLVATTGNDEAWKHTTRSQFKPWSATQCPGSGAWVGR